MVLLKLYVVGRATVGEVKIIGLGRIFSRKCVYLLHVGHNTQRFSVFTYLAHAIVNT